MSDDEASRRPPAIALMGPTAAGKTAMALAIAQRWPCALISVDSVQIYRGLDVGSAKPDANTLAQYPHALLDIVEPEVTYSAAQCRLDALAAMHAAQIAGRIPLLVGGTGLYFRALCEGLDPLPAADPAWRLKLQTEAARIGWAALHQRLAALDLAAAARIHPNDAQRIGRALEVIHASGRALSAQWGGARARLPWRLLKLALIPSDRKRLHQRIAVRFAQMLEAGLIDEVAALRARPGLHASHPSMRAVGYRQVWAHLQGELPRAELLDRGIHATRQLAKRQLTWLRGEYDALPYDPFTEGAEAMLQRAVQAFLRPSSS